MPDPLSLDELRALADTLATGFQAVLDRVNEQKQIETELRHRYERLKERHERPNTSCNSSSGDISDWQNEIVKQIRHPSSHEGLPKTTISNDKIDRAQEALRHLHASKMPTLTRSGKCLVTHKTTDQEDFEHDFTTQGRIGDLGCPFVKVSNSVNGACGPDPIAEEFHGEKDSGRSKSSGAAGSRCPIRFLDKHSPEEVAQYFENHKHEIPRSHQICVKRYQQNEESIRQLDAKYGSLVGMIQGLGNKHKQYLSANQKVADEPERDSSKAVERWAENVSHHSKALETPDRLPHFERPLRDVRVGESPSRPWGISVPVGKSPAASASSPNDIAQPSAKPLPTVTSPMPADAPLEGQLHETEQGARHSNLQPQIFFNGPVFFGYSAEQAAVFLQHLGLDGGVAP